MCVILFVVVDYGSVCRIVDVIFVEKYNLES